MACEVLKEVHHPRLCLVIGDPVHHSLSPLIHNAGYREVGLASLFHFTSLQVRSEALEDTISSLRTERVCGIAVTLPHKVEVMEYLDSVDEKAQALGAVNSIIQREGKLHGRNSDWLGVQGALAPAGAMTGRRALVLGAGGAARSAVFALREMGARVTIANRSVRKGEELALEFGCDFSPLGSSRPFHQAEVIIQATSLGLIGNQEFAVQAEWFSPEQVVMETIYTPLETTFLRVARSAGAKVIRGMAMFVEQAFHQFEWFTGHTAPRDAFQRALNAHFQEPIA